MRPLKLNFSEKTASILCLCTTHPSAAACRTVVQWRQQPCTSHLMSGRYRRKARRCPACFLLLDCPTDQFFEISIQMNQHMPLLRPEIRVRETGIKEDSVCNTSSKAKQGSYIDIAILMLCIICLQTCLFKDEAFSVFELISTEKNQSSKRSISKRKKKHTTQVKRCTVAITPQLLVGY